ncbi:MAG: proton-conducting transporter membrane subunit, partial [Rhodospirillales bacterium]|nr:proton-conducting transporter membrane subunit [Rhodospirillales bacterium]
AFMVFMLASVGMPGTSGFVGEFLILIGVYQVSFWLAALAATGLVLGAAYMLYLYRRVIFGRLTKEDLKGVLDLNAREVAIFAPLIFVTIWMGVYPIPFLDVMHVSVANLIEQFNAAVAAADGVTMAVK